MKRLIGVILMFLIFTPFAMSVTPTRLPNGLSIATESQEATSGPTMAAGDLYVAGKAKISGACSIIGALTLNGVSAVATQTVVGSQTVTTDQLVMGNSIVSGTQLVTGVQTMTVAPIVSDGKYGYTSSAGNTLYSVILATTMAVGSSVDLTLADGKIGCFDIVIGTTSVFGSFTAAAAVSLTTASGTSSTTAVTAASINVSDGGTVVRVTQNAFATATAFIRYWYIN
jgi:hypothetical protein